MATRKKNFKLKPEYLAIVAIVVIGIVVLYGGTGSTAKFSAAGSQIGMKTVPNSALRSISQGQTPSSESICGDNLDNDKDGKADCNDNDCIGQTCTAKAGSELCGSAALHVLPNPTCAYNAQSKDGYCMGGAQTIYCMNSNHNCQQATCGGKKYTCSYDGVAQEWRATASAEVCDGVDNNCDGKIDEGFDKDSDGYWDSNACTKFRIIGADYTNKLDCDDNNPNTYPGAKEICDGKDNDCNFISDDAGVCNSISSCGNYQKTCQIAPNGVPTCTNGVCGTICNAGYNLQNGACVGFCTDSDTACVGISCTAFEAMVFTTKGRCTDNTGTYIDYCGTDQPYKFVADYYCGGSDKTVCVAGSRLIDASRGESCVAGTLVIS